MNNNKDYKDYEDSEKNYEKDYEDYDYKDSEKNDEKDSQYIYKTDNKKNCKNIYGAGVLPFYINNGNLFFLLGKDNNAKWSDFGGKSEEIDKGSWENTASREFYEETIGSVMDVSSIITKIQTRPHLLIKDKTQNGHPYYMYVIKISHKDIYRYNFKSTYAFMKYINSVSDVKKFDYKYFEKTDIQWISLDTLKKSLYSENTTEYPLRSIFKRTMEGNISNIIKFCNLYNEYNFLCYNK